MVAPAQPAREPARPGAARKGPFPDDVRIRAAGFRIRSRPKSGPVTWERGGETYTHAEALAVADLDGPGEPAVEHLGNT
jgi:hypothetical protein